MTALDPKAPGLRLILAASAGGLPAELARTQFRPMAEADAIGALEQAGLWLGPRPVLEETEAYRQIIPYIVLRYGDGFIRYTRTPAGGEARLHGRTSIGLGGHIDLGDVKVSGETIDLIGTLQCAAERELLEELGEVECASKTWAGLLVDNESPVGRVHIGMIGLWTLSAMPAGVAEDAIGDVALCSVQDLQDDAARLEGWSAMLLPWLAKVIAGTPASAEAA